VKTIAIVEFIIIIVLLSLLSDKDEPAYKYQPSDDLIDCWIESGLIEGELYGIELSKGWITNQYSIKEMRLKIRPKDTHDKPN